MGALTRITAAWLIAVFAFFYGGNTLFLHSHLSHGQRVVHSHPYLPGSSHSHTDTVMHFLAAANQAAASMSASDNVAAPAPDRSFCGEIMGAPMARKAPACTHRSSWRAPPAMCC